MCTIEHNITQSTLRRTCCEGNYLHFAYVLIIFIDKGAVRQTVVDGGGGAANEVSGMRRLQMMH